MRLGLVCFSVGLAVVSVYARTTGYGLFADDFEWLVGAQQFDPAHLVDLSGRNHFYRPVLEVYFPAALAACGRSASCFHWLNLVLHFCTSLLLAALVGSVSRAWPLGLLAGLLFAVQPGPVEAVIWVAAASELMATAFFVLTVGLFWRALATARRAPYVLSCISFVACILTHESGVMLLPVLFLTLWLLPPDPSSTRADTLWQSPRRLLLLAPFAVALVPYGAIAYVINSRSYLVTEGHYGIGPHVLTNVLGALATLAVARRETFGLILVAAVFLWAAVAAPRRIRFFALWVLVTLIPFAGFHGGLSSRYLYLPATGFAALTAELLWWIRRPLVRWPRAGVAGWWVLTAAMTLRFGTFAVKNVRAWEQASAPYLEYFASVRSSYPSPPKGALLDVPPPPAEIAPHYIPSLLRWEFADPTLRAIVRE